MGLAPAVIAAQTVLALLFLAGILSPAFFFSLLGLSLVVFVVGRSR
jgi:hypothetical protein